MWVTSRWIIDRLKYFNLNSIRKVAEEKMMMIRRWAVGPFYAIREQFVSGAYLWKYLSDCLQILHTTPLGGLVVLLGYMNVDQQLVQNYDLFRRFDAHFVSGGDLEKYWADYSHIAHTCSLRSLVVPFSGFWILTLKLIQHFCLIIISVNPTERFCGISWKPLKIATPLL